MLQLAPKVIQSVPGRDRVVTALAGVCAGPNQALHLTGAALLVSHDIKLLQRPRQVSLVVILAVVS